MLFNFSRGGWDLVYSHLYTTTNITANVGGGWGPIVETSEPTRMSTPSVSIS